MNQDPNYKNKCKKMFELISSKQKHLFKDRPFTTVAEYLKFFEETYNYDFFPFPSLYPYSPDILDKYAKLIYNSAYLPFDQSGNLLFHTIVQFSKSFHGLFVYGHLDEEDNIAIYTTLYSTEQNNFLEFIKDNENYVLENEKPVGFTPFGQRS